MKNILRPVVVLVVLAATYIFYNFESDVKKINRLVAVLAEEYHLKLAINECQADNSYGYCLVSMDRETFDGLIDGLRLRNQPEQHLSLHRKRDCLSTNLFSTMQQKPGRDGKVQESIEKLPGVQSFFYFAGTKQDYAYLERYHQEFGTASPHIPMLHHIIWNEEKQIACIGANMPTNIRM